MQLKFIKSLLTAQDYESSLSVTWSPNNEKLAIATIERMILLYDKTGELKDKFQTKPSDTNNGKKSYLIQSVCFSPDSIKIAVTQSDSIVYVYKIGETWGDKKVICNKFPQQSQISCTIWLKSGALICGLINGQVRLLNTKINKSQNLYTLESGVISMSSNSSGSGFLSGHCDGSVMRYFLQKSERETNGRFISHFSISTVLLWINKCVIIGGLDKKITFYDHKAKIVQQFDYSNYNTVNDFTSITCSPSEQAILVGGFSRIHLFMWDNKKDIWIEFEPVILQNFYTITALEWNRDGTKIACGSLCGSLVLFEPVIKKMIWNKIYEISYVELNYVSVKSINSGKTTIIQSKYGNEIAKFKFLHDNRFFLAKTNVSLIITDLENKITSEVLWNIDNNDIIEDFYFIEECFCLIYFTSQLYLIEVGKNEIQLSVKLKNFNKNVVSIQCADDDKQIIAYLEDSGIIKVQDISNHLEIFHYNHNDSDINWLQLSKSGKNLIIYDMEKTVYLANLKLSIIQKIIINVDFFKWLSTRNFFMAQSSDILSVWYDIDEPNNPLLVHVDGKVIDINEKDNEEIIEAIIVHSTGIVSNLKLDNTITKLRFAINKNDLGKAISYLESISDNVEKNWATLAGLSLINGNYFLSNNYYSALGDFSSCMFLKNVDEFLKNDNDYIENDIKQAIFNNDLVKAEEIFLRKNNINGAILMYKKFYKWHDALRLAKKCSLETYKELKFEFIEYLKKSNQFEKLAQFFEHEENYEQSIDCYLQAKNPTKALNILQNKYVRKDNEFIKNITDKFVKFGFVETAGDFCFNCSKLKEALEYYQNSKSWEKTINISNKICPENVKNIYELWAQDLLNNEQYNEATNCFIKADNELKALESAINGKLWGKALEITKRIKNPAEVKDYYIKLANHFIDKNDILIAEKLLLAVGKIREVIEMLNKASEWEKSYKLAKEYLKNTDEIQQLFRNEAKKLQNQMKFGEAERVFLLINDVDTAIEMYKNTEQFDDMIRLVEKYHPDLLIKTHYLIARHLESQERFTRAEAHYLAANEWKKIINMYLNASIWDEAYRVAKKYGNKTAADQVIILRAKSLPISSAKKYLQKHKLYNECIDYACEINDFDWAFELCNNSEDKLQEIHYKFAKNLHNSRKYSDAEREYCVANKAKDAVNMYLEIKDWNSAIRVAEAIDKDLVNHILKIQAFDYFEQKNYSEFESIFIRLKLIDELIDHYKKHDLWIEALKICKTYKKQTSYENMLNEYNAINEKDSTENNTESLIQQANQWISAEEYQQAVTCLLKISPDIADETIMKKILLKIAEIVMKFFTKNDDSLKITKHIGSQLVKINEHTIAAQLYITFEMFKEAIDTLILCKDWKRAKKIAQKFDRTLERYVDSKYKAVLKQDQNIDKSLNTDLETLLNENNWIKCLQITSLQNSEIFQKYLVKFAQKFNQSNNFNEQLEMFHKFGLPSHSYNSSKFLLQVANNLFSRFDFSNVDNINMCFQLRDLLYSLILENSDNSIKTCFLISHFYAIRGTCYEHESQLGHIFSKISISLLRFYNSIPADKAFYEAAIDLRKTGRNAEAFVFFSHYLDICDAIEKGKKTMKISISGLEHLPPIIHLPKELYLKTKLDYHEKVREWVLEFISMEHKVNNKLPLNDRNVYESFLKTDDDFCIITGYPLNDQFVTFAKTEHKASREYWAKLTMTSKKMPSSTNLNNILNFIEKWCGSSNYSYL